jgi:hypothetical protein
MHRHSTAVRSRRADRAVSLRRRLAAGVLAAIVALSLVSTADAITVSDSYPVLGNYWTTTPTPVNVTSSETSGYICCNWTFGDGTKSSTMTRTISHAYSPTAAQLGPACRPWEVAACTNNVTARYRVTASGFYMNPITHGPGAPFTTFRDIYVGRYPFCYFGGPGC